MARPQIDDLELQARGFENMTERLQSVGEDVALGVRMEKALLLAVQHGFHARRVCETEDPPTRRVSVSP